MDHAQSSDNKRHRVISNSASAIFSVPANGTGAQLNPQFVAAQPKPRQVDYAATDADGAREYGREAHDESSRQNSYAMGVEESREKRQDTDAQMTVEEPPASSNHVQRSLSEAPDQDVDMLSEAEDDSYCDDVGTGLEAGDLLRSLSEQQLRELRQFFGVDEGTLYINHLKQSTF